MNIKKICTLFTSGLLLSSLSLVYANGSNTFDLSQNTNDDTFDITYEGADDYTGGSQTSSSNNSGSSNSTNNQNDDDTFDITPSQNTQNNNNNNNNNNSNNTQSSNTGGSFGSGIYNDSSNSNNTNHNQSSNQGSFGMGTTNNNYEDEETIDRIVLSTPSFENNSFETLDYDTPINNDVDNDQETMEDFVIEDELHEDVIIIEDDYPSNPQNDGSISNIPIVGDYIDENPNNNQFENQNVEIINRKQEFPTKIVVGGLIIAAIIVVIMIVIQKL